MSAEQSWKLKDTFILDSGASLHIVNSFSHFTPDTFVETEEEDFVITGSGILPILGYGDVSLVDQDQNIDLRNVAFCPEISCNLVSLIQLNHNQVFLNNEQMFLYQKQKILFNLILQDGQFVMKSSDPRPFAFTAKKNQQKSPKISKADFDLWHKRLGHANEKVLHHLNHNARNVEVTGSALTQCEHCAKANPRRIISRKTRETRSLLKLFDELHLDFHDMPTGIDGINRYLLITDRCTGYAWTYSLQGKLSIMWICCLESWYRQSVTQYDTKPKMFRIDNEFITQEFKRWIDGKGMIYEPSPPYTPEANGFAERSGGVIGTTMRELAIQSGLPHHLWDEFLGSAVYLHNRTPKSSMNWSTPISTLWSYTSEREGELLKPDLHHLKAYGCKAYAMMSEFKAPQNFKGYSKMWFKLNERARIGYLVGYVASNLYRIWIPETERVIITRDVKFDETSFYSNTEEEEAESDLTAEERQEIEILQESMQVDERELEFEEELPQILTDLLEMEERGEISLQDHDATPDPLDESDEDSLMTDNSYRLTSPIPSDGIRIFDTDDSPELDEDERQSAAIQNIFNLDLPYAKSAFAAGIATRSEWDCSRDQAILFDEPLTEEEKAHKPSKQIHQSQMPLPPKNWKEVEKHPFAVEFKQAEDDHLQSHRDKNTWVEVTLSKKQLREVEIIDNMWVYVYKFDEQGFFIKCKARLVARGDMERARQEDTYASTLAARSFRVLMAMTAKNGLKTTQIDAVNAFVNADMDREVYMRLPVGRRGKQYVQNKRRVCRVLRAMYGFRGSPLLWHKHLSASLKKLGFKSVPQEPCCWTKDGIIIFFYVDDIVLACQPHLTEQMNDIVKQLREIYDLTGGDALKWFLGIEIKRDLQSNLLWLSQCSYIDKIYNRLMDEFKDKEKLSAETPMSSQELLPNEGAVNTKLQSVYRKFVGSLLYAAIITRPDISFAVSRIARHSQNPNEEHLKAAQRILQYLKNTRTMCLQFGSSDENSACLSSPCGLDVSSDASYADNTIDRKSSQGHLMMFLGGCVTWNASKQDTVTTSTTEAELLALASTAKESIFLGRLLSQLNARLEAPIVIQCDNKQTILLLTRDVATLKTKLRHVDVHNHWLRQEYQRGTIEIVWCPTNDMKADGFTKALVKQKFLPWRDSLNLVEIDFNQLNK